MLIGWFMRQVLICCSMLTILWIGIRGEKRH